MGNPLKNSFLLPTISAFLLLLVVQSSIAQSSRQSVSFYKSPGCNSLLTTVYKDNTYLQLNVSSIKVNGMWRLLSCSSNVCGNLTTYISENGCVPYISNSNKTEGYIQVFRYGDEFQRNASITFYPLQNFTGSPEIVVGSWGLNSTYSLNASSWFFTGSHNWTVYENSNFTGKNSCLIPSSKIRSRGYGISFSTQTLLSFKSVRYGGCKPAQDDTSGGVGLKAGHFFVLLSVLKLMF